MKTDWGTGASAAMPTLLPDYVPSIGAVVEMLSHHIGHETGDPAKVAQVVLKLAYHDALPAHLLLGSDALHYAGEADKARAASGEAWRAISAATDFSAPSPLPPFPAASAKA
jgi:hypothetical protein